MTALSDDELPGAYLKATLATAERRLYASYREAIEFVESLMGADSIPIVALDTETNGEDWPLLEVVGMSLAGRRLDGTMRAGYIPLPGSFAHSELDVEPELSWNFREALQRLLSSRLIIMHGAVFDIPPLVRRGLKFGDVCCTLDLSNLLQSDASGLKDQVLAYGMVDFSGVRSYPKVLARCLGVTEADLVARAKAQGSSAWSFGQVDILAGDESAQEAVRYGCDDALWTLGLYEVLVREYETVVQKGSQELLRWQGDSSALLSESTSRGYEMDMPMLGRFVSAFEGDVEESERRLRKEVRHLMGWNSKPELASAAESASDLSALENLRDGRFASEPVKKKTGEADWTLSSRNLMVHLLYNVLGNRVLPGTPRHKLPSIDEHALGRMPQSFPRDLAAHRKLEWTFKSLRGASLYVHDARLYETLFRKDGNPRAVVQFNCVLRDCVERIFPVAGKSIPINMDTRGRQAFVVPSSTVESAKVREADEGNIRVIEALGGVLD